MGVVASLHDSCPSPKEIPRTMTLFSGDRSYLTDREKIHFPLPAE